MQIIDTPGPLDPWLADLEARHLSDLRFSEVTRALRALSASYVQRRDRLAAKGALDGAGKRAAFAMFYGPLHHLLIRHIVAALPGATDPVRGLLDLGCGTGAAGGAWAAAMTPRPRVVGLDTHPWALGEAAATYRQFGLDAEVRRGDAARAPLPGEPRASRGTDAVLAAYVVNELAPAARDALLPRLLGAGRAGARVLVVEPIATSVAPWWPAWREAFEGAGGRGDDWRVPVALPPLVARLDRAAGLRHDTLSGRSLWLDGRQAAAARARL
ncbi:MAG: methyltransferase domain-containing protein [Vicinamibacterales bacterium]